MTEDLDGRLRRLRASSDVDELIDLGCDLADSGRPRAAEWCFRRAADLDHFDRQHRSIAISKLLMGPEPAPSGLVESLASRSTPSDAPLPSAKS